MPDQKEETERLRGFLKSDGADKVFVVAKDIRAMELGIDLTNKGGTTLFLQHRLQKNMLGYIQAKYFLGNKR